MKPEAPFATPINMSLWTDDLMSSLANQHDLWTKGANGIVEEIKVDLTDRLYDNLLSAAMFWSVHVASDANMAYLALPTVSLAGSLNRPGISKPLSLLNETEANMIGGMEINRQHFEWTSNGTVRLTGYRSRPAIVPGHRESWHIVNRLLNKWATLKPDWDSEGGIAPSEHVIANAKSFVSSLMKNGILPPNPFVAGDGEVGFRWAQGARLASVAFLNDGCVVAFCHSPTMTQPYTLDEPTSEDHDLSLLLNNLRGFTHNDELDRKT